MDLIEWQLVSDKMVVWVSTRGNYIIDASPIIQTFISQPLVNLKYWMRKQGGFRIHRLNA